MLAGERLQRRLGHQVLARPQDPPRKPPDQEGERSLLGLTIGKRDGYGDFW